MEKSLISRPAPLCPQEAEQNKIKGDVAFEALIGIDGKVKTLRLISGHPLLIKAAREAAINSVYRPRIFNGKPAEALGTIRLWICTEKPHPDSNKT